MTRIPMQPMDFDSMLQSLGLSDEAFGFIVGRQRAQIRLWRIGAETVPHEIALIVLLLADWPDALQRANEHSEALRAGGHSTREVAARGLSAKLVTTNEGQS